MRKHLVLIGGGHAHMMTLENTGEFVEKGFKVTVIGPSFYHYYSGMGPGMLGGTYSPDDIRFATRDVVEKQGGIFIKDKVEKIDPDKKEISIEKLMEAADKLKVLFSQKKIMVSIVGGGPSSAEIAGNVRQLAKKVNKHMPDIRIFAGKKFMGSFPKSVRSRVFSSLHNRGIEILETGFVKEIKTDEVCLESGETFSTDFIFIAMGVIPSTIFEESGLPVGPDKGLLVNKYLQSTFSK